MTKVTLNDLDNLENQASAVSLLNANNATIETAFDNTLSRDGTTPNTMGANLDMNSNQILNLPAPATATSPVRLQDVTGTATIDSVPPVGTSGAVVGLLNANNTHSGNNTFSGTNAFAAITGTTVTTTSTITSSGGGIGYTTGAGGTVTQSTSKSTGVTLNKLTGLITLNSAALASATSVSFLLTNSFIAATDMVLLQHQSGGTAGAYTLTAQSASGSATITVRNVTGGSLSEAIVIRFAVLKAVSA